MAWRRRRWAGGDIDVDYPFLFHQSPAVLSVRDIVVHSHTLKQSAIHAWWSTMPVRSRSLLVNLPSGLSQDTSCAVMSAGKCARHMMGCATSGSGDVSAALGCGRWVWGTVMGPGSTSSPQIYPGAL